MVGPGVCCGRRWWSVLGAVCMVAACVMAVLGAVFAWAWRLGRVAKIVCLCSVVVLWRCNCEVAPCLKCLWGGRARCKSATLWPHKASFWHSGEPLGTGNAQLCHTGACNLIAHFLHYIVLLPPVCFPCCAPPILQFLFFFDRFTRDKYKKWLLLCFCTFSLPQVGV